MCDAINATDGSGANCHMSSLGCCALLTRAGYEPVLQIGCRDRNRIAIQGDILGAAALGVHNVLCLTGDDVSAGDQPQAKRVFDFDSIQLLRTARIIRDEGVFLSGRKITTKPRLFLGAAVNPFVPPFDWRPQRMAKKIQAGADFFQTQYCFDVPRMQQFMQQVRDMGLHERTFILAGVGPLRSFRAASFMRNNVPGVHIPDEVMDRLEKTPKKQQEEEGKRICIEIIEQMQQIEGIHGVHVMAYRQEETVSEIIERAKLLPRQPVPGYAVAEPDRRRCVVAQASALDCSRMCRMNTDERNRESDDTSVFSRDAIQCPRSAATSSAYPHPLHATAQRRATQRRPRT